MTLEMSNILINPRVVGGKEEKSTLENKDEGVNRWLPDRDLGKFNYVITNNSKIQTFTVGVLGGSSYSLRPGQTVTFEGSFDMKFDSWTAKLMTRRYVEIKIESVNEETKPKQKVQEEEAPKSLLCACGRKLSPMNKTGVCLYCRKKSGGK